MTEKTFKWRFEQKYYLSIAEYMRLREYLAAIMRRDPHADPFGRYRIRSLYFDTLHNDDYVDKLDGVYRRQKVRLRYYNDDINFIRLEVKHKEDQFIRKTSGRITTKDARSLISDPSGLHLLTQYDHPAARDVLHLFSSRYYRPAALIDYEREAYILDVQNVRITFDLNLRFSNTDLDMFGRVPLLPALDPQITILEVKYYEFLPDLIAKTLRMFRLQRSAISKYCYGRELNTLSLI